MMTIDVSSGCRAFEVGVENAMSLDGYSRMYVVD